MCYEKLAHGILKAEKSHDLPSASWRPRKVSGKIQSESEGLGTRGAEGVSPSLRARRDWCPSLTGRMEEDGSSLPPLSVLFRPPVDCRLHDPTRTEEGNLLYWVHRFKHESHLETSSQTHSERKWTSPTDTWKKASRCILQSITRRDCVSFPWTWVGLCNCDGSDAEWLQKFSHRGNMASTWFSLRNPATMSRRTCIGLVKVLICSQHQLPDIWVIFAVSIPSLRVFPLRPRCCIAESSHPAHVLSTETVRDN